MTILVNRKAAHLILEYLNHQQFFVDPLKML